MLPGYHNTFLESVINTLTYNMCIDPLGEGRVLVTYIPTQHTWDKRIARDEGRKGSFLCNAPVGADSAPSQESLGWPVGPTVPIS